MAAPRPRLIQGAEREEADRSHDDTGRGASRLVAAAQEQKPAPAAKPEAAARAERGRSPPPRRRPSPRRRPTRRRPRTRSRRAAGRPTPGAASRCAASAPPSPPAASWTSRSTRPTRSAGSWRWPRAACGRPRTAGPPGRPSSTARAPTRSAASRSTRANPNVVWVGTGENNSQRSVGYGDGVYKSEDGGKSWKNVGLKASEHIGKIVVHPKDSNVVYVAAQGPLWAPGGDRGLYKTTDGGKTWNAGADDRREHRRHRRGHGPARPRHPGRRVLPAPAPRLHPDRRRPRVGRPQDDGRREDLEEDHERPAQGGDGPHRPRDRPHRARHRLRPRRDRGRQQGGRDLPLHEPRRELGEARRLRPRRAHVLPGDLRRPEGRRARSTRWTSSSRCRTTPARPGATSASATSTWTTTRSGSTPTTPTTTSSGGDGGLYQSFDRGATWQWTSNLPVTQFYRVDVDNSSPVYFIYGGTQDNNTLGGPSRTLNAHGVANHDWFVTWGGDGFHARIDPTDPNIVYSTLQHGVLGRYDRKSGEAVLIQPHEKPGDDPLRWNWDSPLVLSPHKPTRLYFAAQRVFRSEDRGDSWTPISDDLTRRIDRNKLKVMGKVWGPDAVAKGASTSFYGNIVSLDESPLVEGLLYVGTDDGLVQVSEDGGKTWRRQETFPGVPEMSYVSDLFASRFDTNVVYADLQQPQERRLQALRPEERRPRPHLDVRHRRPPGARQRLDDRRGHRGEGAPLRRHRVRPLLHPRRREEVGAAQGRHARDRRARPRDPEARGRPRGRHLRPRLLRPRRPHAAARREAGRPRRGGAHLPGEARARLHPVDALRPQGEGVPRRDVLHRAQPALRRRLHLLPEGRGEDEAQGAPRRREGGGEEGGGDRVPGRRRAARRGARGGPRGRRSP